MAFDVATLSLIQVDYEESDLTVNQIGEKFGTSGQQICKIARREGWRPRRATTATAGARAPRRRTPNAGIARRLSKLINRKLDQMEKGMQSGTLSTAELEHDTKTVGSMIGELEKVVPGPDEDKVRKPDAAQPDASDRNEVERLQREIIERYERIQRRREADGGSQ